MEIQHKSAGSKGKFFIKESGEILGEMTYSLASPNMMIIDHTEISEKIKGKGAGKELVKAGVEYARENGIKILPLCPYAKVIMLRNKDYQDVLIKKL